MPVPVPLPMHNPEMEEKLRRLQIYEDKEKEADRKRKFEEEQALKKMAEEKAKKKEEDMKKAAIQEYNTRQLEKAAKEKKEKEEAEKEFRERVKATFGKAGYSDQSIERILENKGNGGHEGEGQKRIMDLSRPTHIKVHRKHLSPDTLDAYQLPWEFDSVSRSLSFFDDLFTLHCLLLPLYSHYLCLLRKRFRQPTQTISLQLHCSLESSN